MDSSPSGYVINNHDPSSVYYIHPSDASSTQLVSVKFDGNGFNNWKRSMLLVLSAKNKVGFVDGTIAMPDRASIEYKFWSRCNDLVISWIIFNLDATIAKSVLFLQTTKEIWSDLEGRYGYASMTEVYSLEQRLSEIVQGSRSISEFFTAIKTVWDSIADANPLPQCTCKLCTCNLTQRIHDRQQDQKLLQFMMKPNDSFAAVRANVLMMHPLPNVSAAYRLNTQFNGQGGVSNARADNSGGNKRFGASNKPGSNYYCTHCKVPGHSIERCFKIHGYPSNFRPKERVAAIVQGRSELHFTEEQKNEVPASHSGNISVEQYSQLMDLLNKQTVGENSACAGD
ncbi:uncharacterized protein LOC141718779 [Apium graveolens]|uniref:uncharacterized protein LOC141718779 n=1 Tax=Apium graveolens TaxID=4045 RepID=UPI003D7AE573